MKRIINGVTYNTDTSTAIAEAAWKDEQLRQRHSQTLYQTRGGAFFVHKHIASEQYDDENLEWVTVQENAFDPLTLDEAQKWILEGEVEVFSNIFPEPPEATAADDPKTSTTLYVRIPESLKVRLEKAAAAENKSLNAWAIRCMENCLAPQNR